MHDQQHGRCALHPWHAASVVHELVPRSLRPVDWWHPDNRVAICTQAHEQVHSEGTDKWAPELLRAKRQLLYILHTNLLEWKAGESNDVT